MKIVLLVEIACLSTKNYEKLFWKMVALLMMQSTHLACHPSVAAYPKTISGQYGFLTDYSPMEEEIARGKIRDMISKYNIKEFQFYDWFADYSTPTQGEFWLDPYFKRRLTSKATIEIYIDEIHKHGGRAWAYVQATGSEYDNLENSIDGISPVINQHSKQHMHEDRFHVYLLNKSLAYYQMQIWGEEVKKLKFDGIHWDTLGSIHVDKKLEEQGVIDFLYASHELMRALGLEQTLNFVEMHWWDTKALTEMVAFPYAELWLINPNNYLAALADIGLKGVFAKYPYTISNDPDEQFNLVKNWWWQAFESNNAYVLLGDGVCRLVNEYFPNCQTLTPFESESLSLAPRRREVLGNK